MATVLCGCPNSKPHLSRVYEKLHHIIFAKLPNTVGAEFDLLILEGHIWAAVRVEKLRTSDFKPAHIKVAGLHGNMDFRLFLDIALGIFRAIGRFQAGGSLKVIRRLKASPTGIDRDIAS